MVTERDRAAASAGRPLGWAIACPNYVIGDKHLCCAGAAASASVRPRGLWAAFGRISAQGAWRRLAHRLLRRGVEVDFPYPTKVKNLEKVLLQKTRNV